MEASTATNGAASPATPPNKVIFFDLDDTLLERETARLAGMKRLRDVFGPDVPAFASSSARELVSFWDQARDFSRAKRRAIARSARKEEDAYKTLTRVFWNMVLGNTSAYFPDLAVVDAGEEEENNSPSDDQLEACWRTYRDEYEEHIRAMPGAREALQRLRGAGYKIGILTNGNTLSQRYNLCKVGLWHLVDGMVGLDTPGSRRKPNPDMFEVAMQQFNAPPETVMVGDSWRNDVMASKEVGLTPVWFVLEEREGKENVHVRLELYPEVKRIRNFEELLEYLGVE